MKLEFTTHFCGYEISNYGRENGFVDYRTLANALEGIVLNNDIIPVTTNTGLHWEEYNGTEYNLETDEYAEIYQSYIISEYGAKLLAKFTDEIVWYNDDLNMYVWGVTHCGTSWDYVLTDIPCKKWGTKK